MPDIIRRDMKMSEIENVLEKHGVRIPPFGELVLLGLFVSNNANEAEIVGYGDHAEFIFKELEEKQCQ